MRLGVSTVPRTCKFQRPSNPAGVTKLFGRTIPAITAPIVMALGRWKTERMMRRYAAVTDQTFRAAAKAVTGVEPVASQRSDVASGRGPRG